MGRHSSKRDRERDKSHEESKKNKKSKRSRSRSHTYSPSPRRRERSRSRSLDYSRNGGGGGGNYYGSRRFCDGRDNPKPVSCLGVFGMSLHTSERDLKHLFGRYGEVEGVQIVYDRYSGRSRGFAFVYFVNTKDATRAKESMGDAVIDGMKVRVDYSVTSGGGPYRHMNRSMSKSPVRGRSNSRSPSRSR